MSAVAGAGGEEAVQAIKGVEGGKDWGSWRETRRDDDDGTG